MESRPRRAGKLSRCLLDEGAHAGPEHLDAAYVAMYERKAGYDPTDDVDVLID